MSFWIKRWGQSKEVTNDGVECPAMWSVENYKEITFKADELR